MNDLEPFRSLTALREAHRDLLNRRRISANAQFFLEVDLFIRRGGATGVLLDSDEDRWQAQNLLDYWSNELLHADQEPPEATLTNFDPAQSPELDDSLCPYIGLIPYGPAHRHFYFGRERLIGKMIQRLGNGRLLNVIGPPGCGKTSAVMAGLLPSLQSGALPDSGTWHYYPQIKPGSHPLAALARLLLPPDTDAASWIPETTARFKTSSKTLVDLVENEGRQTAVITINQFEELFTLCLDLEERRAYVNNLLYFFQASGPRHTLLLTMRSDIESVLVQTPDLQELFEQSQVRVTAMNAADLRSAIEAPADLVGLNFEDGLVEELIREFLGEPAALPLLQFNMLKLWENRQRNLITWEAYWQIGGGREAVANSADMLYGLMSNGEQNIAHHIFLRLVPLEDRGGFRRYRVLRRSLYRLGDDPILIDRVLDRLILAHLVHQVEGVSPDDDQVEIAHEALITNWPRLMGWLEEARVSRRRRARLTTMAEQWQVLEHNPSALLRGVLLEEAAGYHDLSDMEQAFVNASIEEAEKETQKQLAVQKQKLRAAYRFSFVAVILLVAALLFGLLAARNGRTADSLRLTAEASAGEAIAARSTAETDAGLRATAESEANQQRDSAAQNAEAAEVAAFSAITAQSTAEAAAEKAEAQSRLAFSRELAAAAVDHFDSDPQLGLLLALEAVNLTLGPDNTAPAEAEDALYRALQVSQLQRTLSGHTNWVENVVFSPDGQMIASASLDNTIRLWDADTGQALQTLTGHSGPVNDIAFHPDSSRLVSAGNDGLRMWELTTGEMIFSLASNTPVTAVAFHPDGTRLAAAYADATVRLLDAGNGRSFLRLFGHLDPLTDVSFRPDGRQFATASEDGTAIIWETDSGQPLRSLPAAVGRDGEPIPLLGLSYSPDGSRLATAGANGAAAVWDANTSQPLFTLSGHTSFVFAAQFSPNGRMIATASGDGTTKVWQAENGRPLFTLSGHSGGVTSVAFSPDSQRLVTASQDNTIKIWQAKPGLNILILAGHTGPVLDVAYSPGGTLAATAGLDGKALVWDSASGLLQQTFTLTETAVTAVAFSPDGMALLTLNTNNAIHVWDLADGQLSFQIPAPAVSAMAASPVGTAVAAAGQDGRVILWDIHTRAEISNFEAGVGVNALTYSPDGNLLAVAGGDGRVLVWDLQTESVKLTMSGQHGPINDVAFSPDGAEIATAAEDGTIWLWAAATGKQLRSITGHSGPVLSVVFQPDGSRLATAGVDRAAKLWNQTSGQAVRTFLGHTAAINAAAFSPDGRHLATASSDGTVFINNLISLEELFTQGLSRATVSLTPEQCQQYLRGRPCLMSK